MQQYCTFVLHPLHHAGVLNGDARHRDLGLSFVLLLARVGAIDGERRYRLDKRPDSTILDRFRRSKFSVLDDIEVSDPWKVEHYYFAGNLWGGGAAEARTFFTVTLDPIEMTISSDTDL